MPSVKLVDGRISKKEEISSYLVYNIFNLGNLAGKAEPFSWKKVEYELVVKYLENLAIEKICYFEWC